MPSLHVIPIEGMSEVRPHDRLGPMIVDAAATQSTPLMESDCLVVI